LRLQRTRRAMAVMHHHSAPPTGAVVARIRIAVMNNHSVRSPGQLLSVETVGRATPVSTLARAPRPR
jgi:hypothetical protein